MKASFPAGRTIASWITLALLLMAGIQSSSDVKTGTIWSTGFGRLKGFPAERSPWEALPDLRKPLLVVVDYAGEARKTQMMTQLLGHLDACPAPKVRLLFLERDDRWLDRLHEDPAAREIL